MTHNFIILSGK